VPGPSSVAWATPPWIQDKFGGVSKCATKIVENTGRKRKQTEVTELQFTTASHQVRVQQEADGV
jgi:hypothetical protein